MNASSFHFNQNFKKFKDPLEVRRLEAQAEMARATHHHRSLAGERDTPSEARGKGRIGGRGRGGGLRSTSVDVGGTGRSGGAGRGHMQVCYSCNGVGHKADVCPNNTANWSEDPNLVDSHVARTTRLRSLSQQFNDHVTPGLQLDDDGHFYDAETSK